jgi:Domain of unknown function (DUF4268)
MLAKEEKKRQSQLFWSQFDTFCNTHPTHDGRKKKWILHDTKIGHVDLKFEICKDSIIVALEVNHKSEYRRIQAYEVIEKYRSLLNEGFSKPLTWDYCYPNENGQEVCRIYLELKDVNPNHPDHWPIIYQFMAENMAILQNNFMDIQEIIKEELQILQREM